MYGLNRKTRNIIVVCLLFSALLMLVPGCQSQPASSQSEQKNEGYTTIVTSFYPVYILTKNLCEGIPDVQVVNMTKPQTGCLHDYQLSPEDIKTLEKASIFVVNGAGMESFMDKVIAEQSDLTIIEASRGLPLLESDHETNPHVWLSIDLYIKQVQNVMNDLCKADPRHEEQYKANADKYMAQLEDLRTRMHTELDSVKQRDIVTFHEAFPYFAEEFGLNIVAVIEREPGSEPSAAELAQTVQTVRKTKAKALFVEPQYSSKAAEAIARETGARVYTLDPIVSGPDSNDAYIKIMEKNLQTLKEALK